MFLHKKILLLTLPMFLFSAEYLDDIVVTTGTRTTKLLAETPIRTEVVTAKEIEKIHAKDMAEAIQYIPGLIIKETHGKQGKGLWIQGFDANRVLILIDGEPMTASTGSTVDLSQLNVGDIERIEVIKGAASALYGSQAMGGVINIISKTSKKGLHSKVTLEGGTFGKKGASALGVGVLRGSSTYRDENVSSSIHIDYRHESGIKLEEGYTYSLPELDKVNINGEYRWLGDTEYYIKPRFYVEKTSKPYDSFAPGVGLIQNKKTEDAYKYRLSGGMLKTFENEDKVQVKGFIERYEADSITDKIATSYPDQERKAMIDLSQAEIQYDTVVKEEHLVTMGVVARHEKMNQDNIKTSQTGTKTIPELSSDAKRHGLEAYIQDDWFITDDLELLPGIRYQYDSDFGSYISPKLSLMYTAYDKDNKRMNVRASYGNGYRTPNLKERFFFFDHSALGYQVLGNPKLEPESSHSYQLSSEWIDKGKYSLALNLYYNNITDLIETVKDQERSRAANLDIYKYKNIEEARTKGVELEFSTNINENLILGGGYTYLDAKNKKTGRNLTARPEHQFKTTLTGNYADYLGFVALVHQTEQYINEENTLTSPKETFVDIKLTKHVTKLLTVYGGVNNLFDEHKDPNNHINDERTKRPRYIYVGGNYQF